MLRRLPPLQALARGLGIDARATLRRALTIAAAGLVGFAGFGFVVFAGFAALRLLVGPELAALVVGIALLGLAALVVRFALNPDDALRFRRGEAPPPKPPGASPPPADPGADPATLAAFTAAFVLGRRLADRWRH